MLIRLDLSIIEKCIYTSKSHIYLTEFRLEDGTVRHNRCSIQLLFKKLGKRHNPNSLRF